MDSALASFICCAVVVVDFTSSSGTSSFTSSSVTSSPVHRHAQSPGAYIGCFRGFGYDTTSTRQVNATKGEPHSCRERCRSESFTYTRLWGGANCWCTNTINEGTTLNRYVISRLLEKVNDSECNARCADNSALSCGGFEEVVYIYDYFYQRYIYSVYSVCQKTKYGEQCEKSCNCKDDNHCTVEGVCPSYECAPGWTLNFTNSRYSCSIDIDECQDSRTHNCSHRCNNYEGGFNCSCRAGYELEGSSNCTDVDECDQETAPCDQMCNNTDGSYICSCYSGFSLNQTDRRTCNDVDECLIKRGNCNQTCTNTNGSYVCSCFSGYRLHNDRHTCEDINECTYNQGDCFQQCINSIGSYECRCYEGYELESDRHSCKDVDECSLHLSKCNQMCWNTIGSYYCFCFSGFKLKDAHICIDVDECEINKGGCQHYCNNTPGSFSCSCQPGFRSTGDSTNEETSYNCIDIDECCERSSKCDHICNNTIGNYICGCHSGFQLQDNGFSCNDLDSAFGLRIGLISACCVIVILLAVIIWNSRHRLRITANKKSEPKPNYESRDKEQRIVRSNEIYENCMLNEYSIQTAQPTYESLAAQQRIDESNLTYEELRLNV